MPQSLLSVRSVAAILLVATCAATAARAQPADPRDVPPNEERLLNTPVPDIWLTTTTGARVRLSQITAGKPFVLTLVFTRCAGICSPFLMAWRSAERALGRRGEYARVVLSFDPRDTTDDMAALRHHLALTDSDDWTLAIGDPDDVRRLAAAIGFWWEWNERRQQFDHPAMLAGIRNGRLVRLLVGGSVSSGRLNELVREVSGEFVPSYPLPGRIPFRCVQFDAATGRMTLDWGFGLLLVPVASTSIATFAMFAAGARARRKQTRHASSIVQCEAHTTSVSRLDDYADPRNMPIIFSPPRRIQRDAQ